MTYLCVKMILEAGGMCIPSPPPPVYSQILTHQVLFLFLRIRSDLLIFGPPDPVLFSLNPAPDPDFTCDNEFVK